MMTKKHPVEEIANPTCTVVNYETFMNARIFFSFFILIMSVIPNACLVEQVVASVAEMVSQGPHQNSHGNKQTAPSHSHDEGGHEEDFCCDNQSYLYFGSHTTIDLRQVYQPNAFLYFSIDASQVKNYFQFHSYLHRLRQPTAMRDRDKYALTSLLHAPPYL